VVLSQPRIGLLREYFHESRDHLFFDFLNLRVYRVRNAVRFPGIFVEIIKFDLRTVQKLIDGSLPDGVSPARSVVCPGSALHGVDRQWILCSPEYVPDQLVAPTSQRSHWVVSEDIMAHMAKDDIIPTFNIGIIQYWQEAAPVEWVVVKLGVGPVENRRRDVRKCDKCLVRDALLGLLWIANKKRNTNSRLVVRSHGTRLGRAVIGDEDHERVIRMPGLFQQLQCSPHTEIHTSDLLVVASQTCTDISIVWKERRHFDRFGIVLDRLVARILAFDAPPCPINRRGVRITEGHYQKEWLLRIVREKLTSLIAHTDHIARADFRLKVDRVLLQWTNMILAEQGGAVPVVFEHLEDRHHVRADFLIMLRMRVGVLPIRMCQQTRVDHSPARPTRCGRRERLLEADTVGCKLVQVGRLNDLIAVTPNVVPALVVRNHQQDIPLGRFAGLSQNQQQSQPNKSHRASSPCSCSPHHARWKTLGQRTPWRLNR